MGTLHFRWTSWEEYRRAIVTILGDALRLHSLCFFVLAISIVAAAPADDARVIEMSGEWHSSGRLGSIRMFDSLPAGASLGCTTRQGKITLFLRDGSKQYVACGTHETVKHPADRPGITSEIVTMVNNLFIEKKPLPPAVTVVRGAGNVPLECVLALKPHANLDVSPALAGIKPGFYQLHLVPLNDNRDLGPIRWSSTAGFQLATPDLKPGIYRFYLLTEDSDEIGLPAVVLVVGSDDLEVANGLFHEAEALAPDPKSIADRNLRTLALAAIARKLGL